MRLSALVLPLIAITNLCNAQSFINYNLSRSHLGHFSQVGVSWHISSKIKFLRKSEFGLNGNYLHPNNNYEKLMANWVFFQKGYAANKLNSFGLNTFYVIPIYTNENFTLGSGVDLTLAKFGLRAIWDAYQIDSASGNIRRDTYTEITEPGLSLTCLLMLKMQYKVSKRIKISNAVGLGVLLNDYNDYSTIIETGATVYHITAPGSRQIEPVGFTSATPISIGLSYNIAGYK
jgi:hypothetical protein